MKRLLILCIILSGCSLFEKEKSFNIEGEWTGLTGFAVAKKCCEFEFTFSEEDGDINAVGVIKTPTDEINVINTHIVTGSGVFDGSILNLSLQSDSASATLDAFTTGDDVFGLEASFSGFGFRATDIMLRKKP